MRRKWKFKHVLVDLNTCRWYFGLGWFSGNKRYKSQFQICFGPLCITWAWKFGVSTNKLYFVEVHYD